VKSNDRRKIEKRKRRIQRRLAPRQWAAQSRPMLRASNLHYEMAERVRAVGVGGIAAMHLLVQRLGFARAIDASLHLLKRHVPYHESDHVLNIAYNVLAGHTRLEDLELLRNDEAYLDLLGAQRIPDPTTAGDFLRRFTPESVAQLLELTHAVRVALWRGQPSAFRRRAVIDVDGTLTPTTGEKKAGMEISYKGIWGYHPLLISLANTGEPLYLVNRPGNQVSHQGSVAWLDRAVALTREVFAEVLLRGDSDFALTEHFDRWSAAGVGFVFGYDAKHNLVQMAESLPLTDFRALVRGPRYEVHGEARAQRENVKERIVREREFKNVRLVSEEIAEFPYRPGACAHSYRMIVVRKNLSIEQGEQCLFDDVRYFFYISNDRSRSAEEILAEAHERCGEQENLIEQLKNGIHALRVPLYDLVSNWAYMVIAALAWTFKAWFALTLPPSAREELLHMEFKRFLYALIRIPCQIVRAARRLTVRVLAYTRHVHLLFRSLDATARLGFP
jgi:hypothetical protein